MSSPFPFLSASDLNGLVRFFAAEPACVAVNYERDGVTVHVHARDLAFIHSLDASRFGQDSKACAICAADEMAMAAAE